MTRCAYHGENIKKIEEEWIDENVKDEEERKRKKEILMEVLFLLGKRANCKFDAIEGEFCMFHDPNYWKNNPEKVSKEFLNLLKKGESFFIGFHLPKIEFPKIIEKEINMELAKFHELVSSNGVTFKGIASFYGATFKEVSFKGATFEDIAWFKGATFEDIAWFDGATFDKASFYGVTFKGIASFDRVTFKEVSFNGATFKDEASFDRVTFKGIAWFSRITMGGSAYIVFVSSVFKKPHLVSFINTEIMRFLFLSTEIDKISLTNAKFKEKTLKVHELLNNPKEEVGYTFDDVIETYCRLRGNLEKNHRFSDAGIFFRGEMEARRTRKYYEFLRKYEEENKKDFIEKVFFKIKKFFLWMYVNLFSPYALYKLFSMYGESILRPILCSFITIFLMPIFFTFGGSSISFQSFLSNIGKSIGLFFQLTPVNYKELPSIIPMLELLERILGLLFSFLEAMALKRMLERHP